VRKDPARLAGYLEHMLQAIDRILTYVDDLTEPTFLASALVQDAVSRNFEILGEASRNIERDYPEFAAQHPELPLIAVYEMRNALAHGYFKVDLEIVWRTIQNDLPELRQHIKAIIQGR
jgi:uncharacterized protein with HEPN domain